MDLVVGGAGFIGSHLAEALIQQGRPVRVLDNLSSGHRKNLENLAVEWMHGDAADERVANLACQGVERIFHLAARPSVPWSIEFPKEALRANHGTTQALIQAGKKAGVSRFIFSSSSALYGENPVLPKEESMPVEPKSPYAEHKGYGEKSLRQEFHGSDRCAVSLRYFNVYGPRQDPSSPYSGVISLFTQWAKQGRAPTIFGDGLQTRDFVFVKDVVAANLLAAQLKSSEPAPVINIGTGQQTNLLQLWELICQAANAPVLKPTFKESRPGDVRHSVASTSRAKHELGFEPEVTLADGLRQTVSEI